MVPAAYRKPGSINRPHPAFMDRLTLVESE